MIPIPAARQTLEDLLRQIDACEHCAAILPFLPRPVLQAHPSARLRIVGQAPGRKVHETGIPWSDASGARLRDWLGLTPAQFYDPEKVAIVPIAFCYPGKGGSGDRPPPRPCAALWHDRLNAHLHRIGLTLLVGRHAQTRYLAARCRPTLSETVRAWQAYLPLGLLPLPHPSPRNQPWLVRHRWFERDVVPAVRDAVRALKL